jgi:hypothetical protein
LPIGWPAMLLWCWLKDERGSSCRFARSRIFRVPIRPGYWVGILSRTISN